MERTYGWPVWIEDGYGNPNARGKTEQSYINLFERHNYDGHCSAARSDKPVATDVSSSPPVISSAPKRWTKMLRTAGTNDEPPVRKAIALLVVPKSSPVRGRPQ
jgi:hypothetical protein